MRVPTSPCTSIYVKVFPSILFFFASSRPDPERSLFSDILLLLLLLCDPSEVPSWATGLDSRWRSHYAYIIYIYKCVCVYCAVGPSLRVIVTRRHHGCRALVHNNIVIMYIYVHDCCCR